MMLDIQDLMKNSIFIKPSELPSGESLKDVIGRLKPFWDDFKGLRK